MASILVFVEFSSSSFFFRSYSALYAYFSLEINPHQQQKYVFLWECPKKYRRNSLIY